MTAMKKAPAGRSSNLKDGKISSPAKLSRDHKGGKTVPSFNASRMDKLEGKAPMGNGGVKG